MLGVKPPQLQSTWWPSSAVNSSISLSAAPGARIPCGEGLVGSSTRAHRLLLSSVAACCCCGCHFQGIIGFFALRVWWCENSWPIVAGGLASSIGGLCPRSPRDTNALENLSGRGRNHHHVTHTSKATNTTKRHTNWKSWAPRKKNHHQHWSSLNGE